MKCEGTFGRGMGVFSAADVTAVDMEYNGEASGDEYHQCGPRWAAMALIPDCESRLAQKSVML